MSGVFYRAGLSGVRPRAGDGRFLPYKPTSTNSAPASASPAPSPPAQGIVHRDAHLDKHIVPGVGGITKSPFERSLEQ